VEDLELAQANYEMVGVGPWNNLPSFSDMPDLKVPNHEGFFGLTYKYATIDSGLQIQLCQPGPEDTPQRRFLEKTGGGVYHLGFDVDNLDVAQEISKGIELSVQASGRREDGSGFIYFDTKESVGVLLEVRKSRTLD